MEVDIKMDLMDEEDLIEALDFDNLDITGQDDLLDVTAGHIQENLEDELVQEALKKGQDLRQYSRDIEKELRKIENDSIGDYIQQSQSIASLHYQIKNCDDILARMEGMLSKFQSDLGSISSEIQSLQDQSHSMSVKLQNRQGVRGELTSYLRNITVSEHLVQHITDTPASEKEFTETLRELDAKLKFLNLQSFNEYRSVLDVHDVLIKLKIKAITKTREFLIGKIYQFRRPMANYQMIQNQLLNYKYFNEFLLAHSRETANQIREEYIDTLSKIYYSYFKDYYGKLMKLQFEETAEKDDLMGVEDSAKRGGLFSSRSTFKNRSTVFTLGNRDTVLTTELEDPVIVIPQAQKGEKKYSFEALFRSIHYALVDNASREFLFTNDFFNLTSTACQEYFDAIFEKTLQLILRSIEHHCDSCYDAISLFLCIHIVHRFDAILNVRDITCLKDYSEELQSLLWPRFKHILSLNVASIRDADPHKLGNIDTRPHYITRRYAEFSAALVSINQSKPNEQVDRSLFSLQTEVENFILRMAAEFPDRKEQLVFLINNYDMMLGVLTERTSDESKESECFKTLLHARTQEFVEEVLSPYFGGIISFVKDTEILLERDRSKIKVNEQRIQLLVRGFGSDWRRSLEAINGEVMQAFTNFKNGTAILQLVLGQLIQYYHRFNKILSQHPFKTLPVRSELINIHHLMVEVKKYRQTF